MHVTTRKHEQFTVVEVSGRLDTATSSEFEDLCTGLVEEGARLLVMDLGAVDFVSSAGLRVVLATAKRLKPLGGGVAICNLAPGVQEVFRISGFARLMPVVDDVAGACAALRKAQGDATDTD